MNSLKTETSFDPRDSITFTYLELGFLYKKAMEGRIHPSLRSYGNKIMPAMRGVMDEKHHLPPVDPRGLEKFLEEPGGETCWKFCKFIPQWVPSAKYCEGLRRRRRRAMRRAAGS